MLELEHLVLDRLGQCLVHLGDFGHDALFHRLGRIVDDFGGILARRPWPARRDREFADAPAEQFFQHDRLGATGPMVATRCTTCVC
jgi:hypothetical protein